VFISLFVVVVVERVRERELGGEERRQKASLYDGEIGPVWREQGGIRESPARWDGFMERGKE